MAKPGGGTDAALEGVAHHAGTGAYITLGKGLRCCRQGRTGVLLGDMQAADVAEAGIVALHDQGIDRACIQADVVVSLQHILHQRRGHGAHGQGIGQQNGGLQGAQLLHLDQADALAEAVDNMCPGQALLVEHIPCVGNDGGDAGMYLAVVDGHLAHTNTRHIGNEVALTVLHVAEGQAVSALYAHNLISSYFLAYATRGPPVQLAQTYALNEQPCRFS